MPHAPNGPQTDRVLAQARTRSFPRLRLHRKLRIACESRIALVIADRALGKSTLVRDHLAIDAVAHRRFAAEAEHVAPLAFFRALAETFAQDRPAMMRSYAAAAAHIENGHPESALRWACDHLDGLDTTVVLDDLHHLSGDARCVAFLSALLDAELDGLRWILTLRDASAFPVPRWLASGRAALPIENTDLRVDRDEIAAAFAHAGAPLADRDLDALATTTAGWVLALDTALASGRLDTPADFEPLHAYIVDEAFAAFGAAETIETLELGAIGAFDDRMLAALECEHDLAATLVRKGLAYPIDDRIYAFHEPIRALLDARLDATPAEIRATVLDRAASALAYAGRWSDAVDLRIRADDANGVAAMLADRGLRALDGGEVATVSRALVAVPEAILRRYPVALAVKASLASLEGDLDVSEAWFRIALDEARVAERRTVVIRYGMDLVRRNRPDAMTLLEAETQADAPVDADGDAAIYGLLGTAYVQANRIADGTNAATRALNRLPGVENPDTRARVLHQASYVALAAGEYDRAKALALRALARADESFLYDVSARALSVVFNVATLHEGDIAAARSALAKLEEAGRKSGSSGLRLYAMLNAYAIEADAGNLDMLDRLDQDFTAMQVLLTPTVVEALLPAQALRAAWDGKYQHAYEMLASSAARIDGADRAVYRWSELALYAAAAGDRDAAEEAIRRYDASTSACDPSHELPLRAGGYVALAYLLLDAPIDALVTLRAARLRGGDATNRISTLLFTIDALIAARSGGGGETLFFADLLDTLDDHGLAGVGRLIASLPSRILDPIALDATSLHKAVS